MRDISRSLFIGLLLIPYLAFGDGDTPFIGARSLGLANASVTIKDEWALFNNMAGLHDIKNFSCIAAFHNLYGISSLNRIAFGASMPYKKIAVGTSFYKFGDNYYNNIQAGIGVAHQIQNMSLGIKINYHQISIHEVGSKKNLVIELGGIASITKKLSFGAHIYNINQAKINKENKEYLPIVMRAGINYRFFEKLNLHLEAEKQPEYKTILKSGIEYAVIKKFKLRAGFSGNPSTTYFGAGFNNKKISIDYALSNHSVLGISQQISLTYLFNKNDL